MIFSTQAFSYYPGYILPMAVTCDINQINADTSHDYYQIIFLGKGVHKLTINDRHLLLSDQQLVLLNEKNKLSDLSTTSSTLYSHAFDPVVINEHLTIDCCNDPVDTLSITDLQDLFYLSVFQYTGTPCKTFSLNELNAHKIRNKLIMLEILLDQQESYFWPCQSRAALLEILFMLCEPSISACTSCPTFIDTGCSSRVTDILYYLQGHYNEKITLAELSVLFHTNHTTLVKEFKQATGLTLNQYLMQLRMQIASALLRNTELPIMEVCQHTGFNDLSYFTKAFKKEVSYTPSDYRRLYG